MNKSLEWCLDRERATPEERAALMNVIALRRLEIRIDEAEQGLERATLISKWWNKAKFELGRMRGSTRRF